MTDHWLLQVAKGAGLTVGSLQLAPGTPPLSAWRAVVGASAVTEDELAQLVAAHYRLGVADFDQAQARALRLIPESAARRYAIFPLREDDRQIHVATLDPTDLTVEQAVGFASGRRPVLEVAGPTALQEALDLAYAPERVASGLVDSAGADVEDAVRVVEEMEPQVLPAEAVEAPPIVKLANVILRAATTGRASDIHLEPGRGQGVVRFRVDGVLHKYMDLPMPVLNRVVSRIKILGKLDIADRLRPQDGRARIEVEGRTYDLRLSTVPARDAEKVVIRILDPESSKRLEDLDLTGRELNQVERLLSFRNGILIVTGPTGSGKTTTLYAAIRRLATGEVNIMTVEDPVEYELKGITQIQVEPRRGVTFASALRAILRQDPDIVFVGEIRDLETAEIAVQASMTGHLVLATLHTNDAVGVVPRLCDLGLDRASIAATLRGALAQRLVRRVCDGCATPVTGALTPEEQRLAAVYGVPPAVRAVGCRRCGQTGYRGRVPIVEVFSCSEEVERLITAGAPAAELHRAVVAGGMRSLRESALDQVRRGATTLREVERVLGEATDEGAAEPAAQHVLLVDDDAVSRTLGRTLLEKVHYRVTEAGDGVAALERLRAADAVSVMVLDLDMPRMNGRQVLEQVRRSPATAKLPVIVLTGSDALDTEIELMDRGADDYIRKPIDPPRFVARVRAALRRAGA